MSTQKKRLGDILIDCNLINQDQLKQALGYQKEHGLKLGAALIELGLVTEDDIIWALGNQLNISFIHLNPDIVSRDVIKILTPEFAREHRIIPLYQTGNQLSVCMVDPLESDPIDYLASKTGMQISVSICTKFDFEQTYKAIYGPLESTDKVGGEIGQPDKQLIEERGIPKGMEAPEKVINYILGQAIIGKVDRIHFEPSEKGVLVRFRSSSTLARKVEVPLKIHQEIIGKLKTFSALPPSQGLPHGMSVGHFRVNVSGRMINIQAIFYPTIHGEMVILKLSDFTNLDEKIGKACKTRLEELAAFLRTNHGVLYVTGPRESGRTTTQYFLLNGFDTEARKIVTVENPVQCTLPRLTQIQVGQAGIGSHQEGIDLALLLDPDVIYLDHLADSDVAREIAFAALGGKTILTSFMAYDAPSSVVRLLEMSPDPVIVASSLCGFQSQRLVRTLCPACKRPATLPDEIQERLTGLAAEVKPMAAVGCDSCQKTGYSGRTLIAEFLPTSPALRQMMINRQSYQDFFQFARKQGIPTLEDRCLELVAAGETSLDEFLRLF
ncbi:MAG: General secretion pathway protein E [Candidatus Ozemobacter sibiricus]|jgi:type IV pilus assembly protein PilB|uniref:General secretion pathway protein E n=1 Tax=Candidatus Ozemobacter sibiricus TaxID=2268124 RepID=A0A367ZL26_9BACT|nr:MAG: General secretion pathway protein E [Candidatus Ozemobacter sibiricus]